MAENRQAAVADGYAEYKDKKSGGFIIMSVQIEMLEKNMAKLTIDVPAERFEKAITRAYNKNKGKILYRALEKVMYLRR